MQIPGDLTINVVLTKQDVKQFFFAASKKRFILALIGYGVFIFALMYFMFRLLGLQEEYAGFFVAFLSAFIPFTALLLLVMFIKYRIQVNEFENNKNADKKMIFIFNEQGYTICTPKDRLSMSWHDIARLLEYPSFFVIVRSPGKAGIIPKRCFSGPDALEAFTEMLKSGVEKKKLSLRNSVFTGFSPDLVFIEPAAIKAEEKEPDAVPGEMPLFKISFTLTKKDILKYNFLIYYTRPSGLIATILGLVLLLSIMMGWGNGIDPIILTNALQIILCFMLLAFAPLFLFIFAMKSYKMDAVIKKSVTYHFFSDHIVIFNAGGVNNKKVGDFRRLNKIKSFYLFYLAKNMAYTIPERYIEDQAAFNGYFRFIQAENRRLNSYAATNTPITGQEPSRFCTGCGAVRLSADHMFCPECGKKFG